MQHFGQRTLSCPSRQRQTGRRESMLQGEEIGRLIANALEGGITERRPWYEPAEKLPDQPIINTPLQKEFDTLVVDLPSRNPAGKSK